MRDSKTLYNNATPSQKLYWKRRVKLHFEAKFQQLPTIQFSSEAYNDGFLTIFVSFFAAYFDQHFPWRYQFMLMSEKHDKGNYTCIMFLWGNVEENCFINLLCAACIFQLDFLFIYVRKSQIISSSVLLLLAYTMNYYGGSSSSSIQMYLNGTNWNKTTIKCLCN